MIQCYVAGVIVTAISLGSMTIQPVGWLVVGMGLLAAAMLKYLN